MPPDGNQTSAQIISEIRKRQTVCICTGNIQRHQELFRRMFKNSAEELLAAITYQLDGPNGPELEMMYDFC
ncbi:unnamed protein product [Gongylonema pulchrum]|uniref:AAA_6 domain-containing protein n=1 Tax=Gongylonema pulchrum TaxID=637853 RepID=A0A183EDU7_9BILA|nr:unnamed protein product [Gongylonema pulchrum]